MDSLIDANGNPQNVPIDLLPSSRALVLVPVGITPDSVRAWFDSAVETSEPILDGTMAGERDASDSYRRMAKAENTRRV